MRRRSPFMIGWVFGALLLAGCGGGDSAPGSGEGAGAAEDPEAWTGDLEEAARLIRPREGTESDWLILREKAAWAWDNGLDTVPMGAAMAGIGLSFVDTPYAPGTLELAGDEAVVVNLEEMDCVTFVENVLALALFIREAEPGILQSDQEMHDLYRQILTRIRYRDGRVDGYSSRLHYFSDWILDNEGKGMVREITEELGGIEDDRVVDFMSSHREAYRQLADPGVLRSIREREQYLNGLERFRIPEGKIADRAGRIRDGDIIAVTSTVDGLDVAHTGLAVWREGALRLLHAPLVGEAVQVSELPLADRVLRLETQDGIRVVRAVDPPRETGSRTSSAHGRDLS